MTATMAMQARSHAERGVQLDTDAYTIGVDNRCSGCLSGFLRDFEGPLVDTNKVIKGFMGAKTIKVQQGAIKWRWHDDEGRIHTFHIPNSYYVKDCPHRLLSPQHWEKELQRTCKGRTRKTTTATSSTRIGRTGNTS